MPSCHAPISYITRDKYELPHWTMRRPSHSNFRPSQQDIGNVTWRRRAQHKSSTVIIIHTILRAHPSSCDVPVLLQNQPFKTVQCSAKHSTIWRNHYMIMYLFWMFFFFYLLHQRISVLSNQSKEHVCIGTELDFPTWMSLEHKYVHHIFVWFLSKWMLLTLDKPSFPIFDLKKME